MGTDSRLRGHRRETRLNKTALLRLPTADGAHLGRRHNGLETAASIRRSLEQVADLHRLECRAADLENENWGRF
ncbi:hypothetical protein ACQVP2_02345 [Methylobacterium aquaticum]|uniref:hypothetical protein n=1 Tax=Methylobacterium aquaticum TaxID=270351 RepID=UPI003D16BBC0